MIALSVFQAAQILSATLVSSPSDSSQAGDRSDSSTKITSVVTDSRQASEGSLFVAIKGERVDGHDYVNQAARAGACAALVEHPVEGAVLPQLVVTDTIGSLGRLARYNISRRRQIALAEGKDFTVVGITGSVGKTTTKDLVKDLLQTAGTTIAPVGSFNNEIGLPLTAVKVDETTRYFVAEMGASAAGEIAYLTRLVPPDIAVELKVGAAHLGGFGSVDGIRQAKSELVQALTSQGIAVLNAQDLNIRLMTGSTHASTLVWFSDGRIDPQNLPGDSRKQIFIYATDTRQDQEDHPSFTLHLPDLPGIPVTLGLSGVHNVMNALAAVSVAYCLGVRPQTIASVLFNHKAMSPHRMAVSLVTLTAGESSGGSSGESFTLIDDSFNANPDSMKAGLDALSGWKSAESGNEPVKIAVLGSMLELGPREEDLHHSLGAYAAQSADYVVTVGSETDDHLDTLASALCQGACQRAEQSPVRLLKAYEEHSAGQAAARVAQLARQNPGSVVLLKGSHASGLQTLANMWSQSDKINGEVES